VLRFLSQQILRFLRHAAFGSAQERNRISPLISPCLPASLVRTHNEQLASASVDRRDH
jgi:hypothetical protein